MAAVELTRAVDHAGPFFVGSGFEGGGGAGAAEPPPGGGPAFENNADAVLGRLLSVPFFLAVGAEKKNENRLFSRFCLILTFLLDYSFYSFKTIFYY
jgi:hypothetical protein